MVLAEISMKAMMEVLRIRSQYFPDITEQSMEVARKMEFLVEQGLEAVLLKLCLSGSEYFTLKRKVDAAKHLEKAPLGKVCF